MMQPDPPGITITKLNHALFVVGVLIVLFSTWSLVAVLGTFVASLHIRFCVKDKAKEFAQMVAGIAAPSERVKSKLTGNTEEFLDILILKAREAVAEWTLE